MLKESNIIIGKNLRINAHHLLYKWIQQRNLNLKKLSKEEKLNYMKIIFKLFFFHSICKYFIAQFLNIHKTFRKLLVQFFLTVEKKTFVLTQRLTKLNALFSGLVSSKHNFECALNVLFSYTIFYFLRNKFEII